MRVAENSKPPLVGFPLAVIVAASFCVVAPFHWLGIPSGHDFEFHLNSWLEVLQHWKEGVAYPHWAAFAHYGYGEARFIFYPPLSWMLGAALGAVLPWKLVSSAYIWLVLSLCGCSIFVLARRWFSKQQALIAALAYALNPYHLVIVYWRSAMAELLAAACLPILLLLVMRLEEGGARIIPPLSLILAAGWLANVPTAVMMNYSLAALALWISISHRSWKPLAQALLAAALGAALASVYLVPVFHQQHWVSISQVLAPGVRPVDNFLFTITSDPDHNRFNRLVSEVAACEIVLLALLLALSRRSRHQTLWRALAIWAALSTVLMIRFTLPLWMHLPELRYVQLPWRWLLCLNVVFAMAVVMAFRRWYASLLVCVVAICSVVWVWHRVLPPWWDNVGDIQEMVDNQEDWVGNEGTDEYVPAGVDPYDIDQNAPKVRFLGAGTAQIRIEEWKTEKRAIVSETRSAGKLVFRLFDYPLWKVEVNGHAVQTETRPNTGEMIVPISAGANRVDIEFVEGWDRALGASLSIAALVLVVALKLRMSSRRAEGLRTNGDRCL